MTAGPGCPPRQRPMKTPIRSTPRPWSRSWMRRMPVSRICRKLSAGCRWRRLKPMCRRTGPALPMSIASTSRISAISAYRITGTVFTTGGISRRTICAAARPLRRAGRWAMASISVRCASRRSPACRRACTRWRCRVCSRIPSLFDLPTAHAPAMAVARRREWGRGLVQRAACPGHRRPCTPPPRSVRPRRRPPLPGRRRLGRVAPRRLCHMPAPHSRVLADRARMAVGHKPVGLFSATRPIGRAGHRRGGTWGATWGATLADPPISGGRRRRRGQIPGRDKPRISRVMAGAEAGAGAIRPTPHRHRVQPQRRPRNGPRRHTPRRRQYHGPRSRCSDHSLCNARSPCSGPRRPIRRPAQRPPQRGRIPHRRRRTVDEDRPLTMTRYGWGATMTGWGR